MSQLDSAIPDMLIYLSIVHQLSGFKCFFTQQLPQGYMGTESPLFAPLFSESELYMQLLRMQP